MVQKRNKKENLILHICRKDNLIHYRLYFRDNQLSLQKKVKLKACRIFDSK